jgi:hypothetical protein
VARQVHLGEEVRHAVGVLSRRVGALDRGHLVARSLARSLEAR